MSAATITQHEKLLGLGEEYQRAIHAGTVSRDAAFVIANVPEERRQEVLDDAIRRQRDDEDQKKGKKSGAAKKGGVKSKHVKAAARDAGVASGARSKGEIKEFFEGCMGPAYGHPDGAVHQYCKNMLLWIDGEITDRTLYKYFDAMVEGAPKGTMPTITKGATNGKPAKKK